MAISFKGAHFPQDIILLTFPSADLSLYPRGFLNYTL
jgi:hypothetical protein